MSRLPYLLIILLLMTLLLLLLLLWVPSRNLRQGTVWYTYKQSRLHCIHLRRQQWLVKFNNIIQAVNNTEVNPTKSPCHTCYRIHSILNNPSCLLHSRSLRLTQIAVLVGRQNAADPVDGFIGSYTSIYNHVLGEVSGPAKVHDFSCLPSSFSLIGLTVW